MRQTGDSFGTTGCLSTENCVASLLSPLARQREQGWVHRVGCGLSARQRWQKCSCPHAAPPTTSTTMYLEKTSEEDRGQLGPRRRQGWMKAAPTYRAYQCWPRIQDAIWNRPEGRGGPWAQKQARGGETDPQAAHGPPEVLRRELGWDGTKGWTSATYACEVRRKLSRTSTDSALLNR